MNVQALAKIFGIILILIGILGFVPGITTEDGLLLGVFAVNPTYNIVHIVIGGLAVWAASSHSKSVTYFKLVGVIFAIIGVLGLLMGTSLLGVFPTNMTNDILHLVIALVALYGGFTAGKTIPAPPSMSEYTAPSTNPNPSSSVEQNPNQNNQNSGMM